MKNGLVLVDLQNDYFPGGRMELHGIETAARNAALMLGFFRKKNWPVFHVRHISLGDRATFFLPDTQGAEIHDGLQPAAGETVITKHYPNGFRQTTLLESLQDARVEGLTICGAMSHMCIDATTRAAFDLGFRCTVIADACATRNLEFNGMTLPAEQVHGSFMAALAAVYARILTCDGFASEIAAQEAR